MAGSVVGLEHSEFVSSFARMCEDGWRAGYHECNGGNASYRLTDEDLQLSSGFFDDEPGPWSPIARAFPDLAGASFLVTGSGKFLRNVALDPARNCGIIQVDAEGRAWRRVWGLTDGARPTSELASHLAVHAIRMRATHGACRVLYHAHPTSVAALTALVEPDARVVSRLLWKTFSEAIIAIPSGIGVLPWMQPGSQQLADATERLLAEFPACIWALHGVFASGATFDEAFGLVSAVDKAADAYLRIRSTGADAMPIEIPDEGLRETAHAYGLPLREDFLD